jgi:spore germination cell wall hydrolase CwlJ-like protein
MVMPVIPKKYEYSEENNLCLAKGIYFEAGNQSKKGKQAVAFVIFNRSLKFNKSLCEVISHKLGNKCQFDWYCQVKGNTIPSNKNWNESYEIAKDMIKNYNNYHDFTDGSLYFHATYAKAKWMRKQKFTIKIDDHLFYK